MKREDILIAIQKKHLKRGEIMDSSGSRSTDMVIQQLQNADATWLSVV